VGILQPATSTTSMGGPKIQPTIHVPRNWDQLT
jgi:hypothetical protein